MLKVLPKKGRISKRLRKKEQILFENEPKPSDCYTQPPSSEPSGINYSISSKLCRQPIGARLWPERELVITPRTLEIAVHHPAYQMDLDVTKMPPDTVPSR